MENLPQCLSWENRDKMCRLRNHINLIDRKTMKYCPVCSERFDEEIIKFCTRDGTPLVEEEQPSFTALPSESLERGDDDFGEETIIRRKPMSAGGEEGQSERIVIPTSMPADPQVRPRTTQGYYQPPPPPNTAKTVVLTILGTLVVLSFGAGLFWLLQKDPPANVNVNTNGNLLNQNTNLNTNLGFDSNFNFNTNANFNTNYNLNTNFNFNTNTNANVNKPTPTPRPSVSPTPLPAVSPTPATAPTPRPTANTSTPEWGQGHRRRRTGLRETGIEPRRFFSH